MKRNLIISVSLFILLVIIILIITFNVKHKNEGDKQMENINNISVIINDKKYSVTFLDNETAQKFVSKLPQEFEMEELNMFIWTIPYPQMKRTLNIFKLAILCYIIIIA